MSNLKKVDRIGVKSPVYFEVNHHHFPLAIGIVLANLIQPGKINKVAADPGLLEIKKQGAAGINWWESFPPILPCRSWSWLSSWGIIVSLNRRREKILTSLDPVTQWVFWLLKIVMLAWRPWSLRRHWPIHREIRIQTLIPWQADGDHVRHNGYILLVVLGLILRYFKLSIFSLI